MSTPDLDASLQIILDSLPVDAPGETHRQHALTRGDALLISNMIKVAVQGQGCSIGLTDSTVRDIKDIVRERRRIINTIGLATLAVMGWIGKWIFEKIDWVHVWHIMTGKP